MVLKSFWDECLVGVALLESDGTFVFANPAFCNIVEYTEPELRARTYQSITHPDDVDADTELATDTSNLQRDKYFMVKRYITKRGKVITVRLCVNPIVKDGEFLLFLSQIILLEDEQEQLPTTEIDSQGFPKSWRVWAAVFAYVVTEVVLRLTE